MTSPPFARSLNAIPISYTEFAPAARDYPLVFTSADAGKTYAPVAVLGVGTGALVRNQSLKFESRHVYMRVENAQTIYTTEYEEGDVLKVHIAHGMGNYVADEDVLEVHREGG